LAEVFFESEEGIACDIRSNSELSLYGSAEGEMARLPAITHGLSVDVGDVTTTVSAFVQGRMVASRFLRLGGRDVTNYLRELLNNGTLNNEGRSQGLSRHFSAIFFILIS
jgi:actin-related protein